MGDDGVAFGGIVRRDVVLVHIHFGEIDLEAHLANGLYIVGEALAKSVRAAPLARGFECTTASSGAHSALLHAARQQFEDQAPPLRDILVVVFNSIVVVSELGVRISGSGGPEGQIDVIWPHLLVPERLAQSARQAVAGQEWLALTTSSTICKLPA